MTPQPKAHATAHSSPYSNFGRSPSFDPPSFTTDDLSVARYTKQSRMLEWLRIILSTITLATSIAITACAGVTLRAYSDSHVQPEWLLPLWPLAVDLRPTHAILACGVVIAVLSLVYLIVAFAPMVRVGSLFNRYEILTSSQQNKILSLNLASTLFAIISFLLALFTTIFAAVITNNLASSTTSGSLNSWTCKWQGFEHVAPANFTKICNNGNAAYDLVLLLTILEFLGLCMAAGGWLVAGKLNKARAGHGISKVELV